MVQSREQPTPLRRTLLLLRGSWILPELPLFFRKQIDWDRLSLKFVPFYWSPESTCTNGRGVTCRPSTIESDFGYLPVLLLLRGPHLDLSDSQPGMLLKYTVTDRFGVRLPSSTTTCCCRRLSSPADPRAKDAFSRLHMEGRNRAMPQ